MEERQIFALERLRYRESSHLGIREEFMRANLGGGNSVAVLSSPLGDRRALGWVICHSFGLEQGDLQSVETPLARQLSANGFPVLRYHGQGYGDSDFPAERVSLQSHLTDALDAAGTLTDKTGVSSVGLIGARFGATVASLIADRLNATALVMWDPVINGRSYAQRCYAFPPHPFYSPAAAVLGQMSPNR